MPENDKRQISLGGITFQTRFLFPMTPVCYFRDFYRSDGDMECSAIVSVSQEEMRRRAMDFGESAFAEYNLLMEQFAKQLLGYDRCLFHGVALCTDERAWLITAPSGTGKSTQYLRWKELYGDQVRLINGDKPILEFQSGGDIIVHPSPWMGKERWRGNGPAKLAGIIYLEQGKKNQICPMAVCEAVIPLYTQFLYRPEEKSEILQVSSMLDRILRTVPVWKLVNRGDLESARLTHDTVLKERRNRR